MPEKHYSTDVVIIGAGTGGLFAVFQCGMLQMKCHVVDSLAEIGGQCSALYPEKPIYDIPGYPSILAGKLVEQLEEQAKPFYPTYHLNQKVTSLKRGADGRFTVHTSAGLTIDCAAVIIAAGAGAFGPNRPPLARLEEFEGNAVFYMVKRRADFAGKKLVIAGGGDSAVDWALSLSDIAEKIYFVHRRDKFRAAPESVAQLHALAAMGKVEMVIPYQLHALHGQGGKLEAVELADLDGKTKTVPADILLPFFGIVPHLDAITEWGMKIDHHHIVVSPATMQSSLTGVFAIGDVAKYDGKLKLILTGFAEAATAAHAIYPLVFPGKELHFEYSTTKGIK